MNLVFLDDAVAADFQPFALTRPCCELRVGALLVRQRWEMATGMSTRGFVGAPHLTHFSEPGAASFLGETIPAGSILVTSRCAVALQTLDTRADGWSCEGRVAAVRLRSPMNASDAGRDGALESLATSGRTVAIEGRWLDYVWDMVRLLPELLAVDVPALGERAETAPLGEVTTIGSHRVFVERGATVEPMVLFDATAGPILVRRGATIQAFTRLVGPCVIGEGTMVNGGRVASSSIGEHCRVHGEVSVSIFTGHANKGHDGFIGHSVLGRWVNLGAGTTNSNLKNNYGDVALWTPRGLERTGMQFLGSFLGDHAKTAILTRLTTGAVVGAGANVYGTGMTPRYVPPFAWGLDGSDVWELGAFLDTAERAMKRRDVPLTESARQQITAAWEREVGDKR